MGLLHVRLYLVIPKGFHVYMMLGGLGFHELQGPVLSVTARPSIATPVYNA